VSDSFLPDDLPEGAVPDGVVDEVEVAAERPPYVGGVGSRREARERALGLLYESEAKSLDPAEVIESLVLEPDPFTADLVLGVAEHRDEVDDVISRYAKGWTVARMPALDRALLRVGVFELVHRPDVPTGAVISEAVELAKRFSTEESGRFVNGVLSAIANDVRN
jgi:transcription antitermination protein NusB